MTGLRIVMGNRLEALADALADQVAAHPLPDPLAPEHFLTQTEGMALWLTQHLAARSGVAANLCFLSPDRLIDHLAAVCGLATNPVLLHAAGDGPPRSSFEASLLPWAVAGALPAAAASAEGAPLSGYLATDSGEHPVARQFQLAKRLADLFDQYAVYRPALLSAWDSGQARYPGDPHEPWQAALWREMRRRSPADEPRHVIGRKILASLRESPTGQWPALPPRLLVFGLSLLPPFFIEVLDALSQHAAVWAFLVNPSRDYWLDLSTPAERRRVLRRNADVEEDRLLHLEPGNPLLAGMARTARDFFRLLPEAALFDQAEDLFVESAPAPPTLLQVLQADILDNRSPAAGTSAFADACDLFPDAAAMKKPQRLGSLRFAVCHNPRREVEALHDHLLRLFEELPGLEPRDVIVMTPDVEAYAPLVASTFGAAGGETAGGGAEAAESAASRLPFTLADRAVRRENALAAALGEFLELPGSRLEFSRVWDLFDQAPVRECFPVDPEQRAGLRDRLWEAGIRWGLEGPFKRGFGLPEESAHTWRFGLDRLLLGLTLAGEAGPGGISPSPYAGEAPLFAGILPAGDAVGLEPAALAAFLDYFTALETYVAQAEVLRTLAGWAEFLRRQLVETFFDPEGRPGERAWVDAELERLTEGEKVSGFSVPVPFAVVRDHLRRVLEEPVSRGGFLRGGITVCTLKPLRSVPFRVVALLGLDHESFPRRTPAPGFDLTGRHPERGDRDPREADRALFFETLLSARDHLYLSWTGFGPADGKERLPASVVEELADALAAYLPAEVRLSGQSGVKALPPPLRTVHRLQAFHPAYFDGVRPELFTYSAEAWAARQATGETPPAEPFHRFTLPPPDPALRSVSVADFVRFFQDPVEFLLKRRLDVHLDEPNQDTLDEEPVYLGPLEAYTLTSGLLPDLLADRFPREDLRAAGGLLPEGTPGTLLFEDKIKAAASIVETARKRLGGSIEPPRSVAVALEGLGTGGALKLDGEVEGVRGNWHLILRCGKFTGRSLVDLWLRHLALAAGGAQKASLFVGNDDTTWQLPPLAAEKAQALLSELADLYLEGLQRPLPFVANTAWAYRMKLKGRESDVTAAEEARQEADRSWLGSGRDNRGESTYRPYARLVFRDPGENLFKPGEPNHDPAVFAEFVRLARQIFQPVEQVLVQDKVNNGD